MGKNSKGSNLALTLLSNSKSVSEKAVSYNESIARDLQKNILDSLQDKLTRFEDKKFSLEDFSLQVDVNAGVAAPLTRDQATNRFKELIDIEYEIVLVQAELKAKQAAFDKYFG